jgi:hypothetical protein
VAHKRERVELREKCKQQASILDSLRQGSEFNALDIIQMLKAGHEIAVIHRAINGDASLRQPSYIGVTRAPSPTYSDIEHELAALYGIVYPKLSRIDIASTDLVDPTEFSLRPSSCTLDSSSGNQSQHGGCPVEQHTIDSKSIGNPITSPISIRVTGAGEEPRYCDDRLKHLDIRFWTSVPISNDLAARAISFFLKNDHGMSSFFDADLLLSDLVTQRLDNCSTFLVTSLLALACVSLSTYSRRKLKLTISNS